MLNVIIDFDSPLLFQKLYQGHLVLTGFMAEEGNLAKIRAQGLQFQHSKYEAIRILPGSFQGIGSGGKTRFNKQKLKL